MAGTTRLALATSAVTVHHYLVTACNYATRMATKVALRNLRERLSDHEWTKKWTLPQNGRSLDLRVTASRLLNAAVNPVTTSAFLGTNPAGLSVTPGRTKNPFLPGSQLQRKTDFPAKWPQ
jgi:hypothetical protein